MDIYQKDYAVTSYLINAQGKVGLYYLLNLLQDIAIDHAKILGLGREEMTKAKLFWVLTRQNLEMSRWPKWNEQIQIQTWIRKGEGNIASIRDFSILQDGHEIGKCSTTWVALDMNSRKPASFEKVIDFPRMSADKKINLETHKIPVRQNLEEVMGFNVRNSDIDQNSHVNNTKYAQWILDSIPFDLHFKVQLLNYEVNFISETKLNDFISIYKDQEEVLSDGTCRTHFQGVRSADSKVVFTSILHYIHQ